MDFPPSVQITGDLSAGKCKNGMMAGRLGHADGAERHRDYATDTAVRFSPVREEDGGVGGGAEEEKMYFVQTRTDDAFTITAVRSSAKQSISEAAERPAPSLSLSLLLPPFLPLFRSLSVLHRKIILFRFFFLLLTFLLLSVFIPFILH